MSTSKPIQKKLLNFDTYSKQAPTASSGKEKPKGTEDEIDKIVKEFLTPAGDQTAFVLWAKKNVTMSALELGLMVINFRKTKVNGKKGKTAGEWDKVVKRVEEEYGKAIMSVKPPFNERVIVREMCFKYGMYLKGKYFKKKDKDLLKFCASKCAIYVCGVGWLMEKLEEQIEEMIEYMNGKKKIEDFVHRRPINVIELTRLENEKDNEADLEGILAWLMVVFEPIMTITLEDEVDYIEEIKAIQSTWHEMWEDVISGKPKKIGTKSSVESRVNSYKSSSAPNYGGNGNNNNNQSGGNDNSSGGNNNNNNNTNQGGSGKTGTNLGGNVLQTPKKPSSKKNK